MSAEIRRAVTTAYAIDYGFRVLGAHPFIGAHYFMRMPKAARAIMSVALFSTLSDADAALKMARKKNPKAEIVPVNIGIEEIVNIRTRQKLGIKK
jgi:hypothetical protein